MPAFIKQPRVLVRHQRVDKVDGASRGEDAFGVRPDSDVDADLEGAVRTRSKHARLIGSGAVCIAVAPNSEQGGHRFREIGPRDLQLPRRIADHVKTNGMFDLDVSEGSGISRFVTSIWSSEPLSRSV